MNIYTYKEIIEKNIDVLFIDVRSESEFKKEHIPNAINIPVLDDNERKIVGEMYKKGSKRDAKKKGLEFAAPKLMAIYDKIAAVFDNNKQIVIYCARGGIRSNSITSIMQNFFYVARLEGGYKGYRDYIRTNFADLIAPLTFVTLYGPTGCGKTALLKELANRGYDILDLEVCANNRGSILGGIGLTQDHSQKYFESLVFESLRNAKSKVVFTEGESKRIGSIVMMATLYEKTRGDYKIYIDCPLERRIKRIKEEYITDDLNLENITVLFDKLKRYHGSTKIDKYLELLKNKQSEQVIESLIVDYYDRVYSSKDKDFKLQYTNNNEKECVNEILNDFKNNNIIQ